MIEPGAEHAKENSNLSLAAAYLNTKKSNAD